MRAQLLVAAFALAGALMACGTSSQPPVTPNLDAGSDPLVMPDFSLVDQNPSSATSGQSVSPRAHEGAITGWYFSHTT